MNPWTVQQLVYELVVNHWMTNDPEKSGFPFKQKYDPDYKKSDVHIAIANDWKPDQPQKRPAVFIARDDAQFQTITMKQDTDIDVAESERSKLGLVTMPIRIACIGTNIGMTEMVAEFTRTPFRYFQQEIQHDFGFRKFRLVGQSSPQIYVESKDHFIVVLSIQTTFDDQWIVKGDHLRIKTISKTIFDGVLNRPLLNQ